jgi:hypothetical protein
MRPAVGFTPMVEVELLYHQHLTQSDRDLLEGVVGAGVPVTSALAEPATEEAVFGTRGPVGMTVGVSPFLAFATAVHRTAARLEKVSFVEERWAPRVRVPVFDVAALRALLSDPLRRWFLVELLASYTRVSSGVTWSRTARGWRRRRFSELDPVSLAEQLQYVGTTERPGVYRRLGDLALFLLGVFPDHLPSFGGSGGDRLLRLAGMATVDGEERDGRALLELLGSRWYSAAEAAARAASTPVTGSLVVAGYMGEHFDQARRVLNAVTDRYLFPMRDQLFGT